MSKRQTLFTAITGFAFVFFSMPALMSQDEDLDYEEPAKLNFFEFSVDPILPAYQFSERLGKDLVGVSFAYLRQRKLDRMDFFGVQFSYVHIGSITETFFDFEDRTSTELLNLRFVYRFFPDFYFWRVEPFIEASFGPQLVFTGTSTSYFLDDTANYQFEETDYGISYGAGVGFIFHIAGQFFFLTKYSFMGGNTVNYYVPGEYVSGLPFENFEFESSSINYHNLQFGLTISF